MYPLREAELVHQSPGSPRHLSSWFAFGASFDDPTKVPSRRGKDPARESGHGSLPSALSSPSCAIRFPPSSTIPDRAGASMSDMTIGKFTIVGELGAGAHSKILHIRRAADSKNYALKVVP